MTKIVYNDCYGGFSLSDEGFEAYLKRKGIAFVKCDSRYSGFGCNYYKEGHENDDNSYLSDCNMSRNDPDLIAVVEELGEKANGSHADLKIAVVAKGTLYRIDEYDGTESVMTIADYDWETA